MAQVLKESSDLFDKINRLHELMNELGITIRYDGGNTLKIHDEKSNRFFDFVDKDTSEGLMYFPSCCEYKLVLED